MNTFQIGKFIFCSDQLLKFHCSKTFTHLSSLQRHVKKYHGPANNNKEEESDNKQDCNDSLLETPPLEEEDELTEMCVCFSVCCRC